MSWSSRKKSTFFVAFILSEEIFFSICVLSQCIMYRINIPLAVQKKLIFIKIDFHNDLLWRNFIYFLLTCEVNFQNTALVELIIFINCVDLDCLWYEAHLCGDITSIWESIPSESTRKSLRMRSIREVFTFKTRKSTKR